MIQEVNFKSINILSIGEHSQNSSNGGRMVLSKKYIQFAGAGPQN